MSKVKRRTPCVVACAALGLAVMVSAPASAQVVSGVDCDAYSPVWNGTATVGLGLAGVLVGAVVGAYIGDLVDTGPDIAPWGEGFANGMLIGGILGSTGGSVLGSSLTAGPCASGRSITGALIGAGSAAAITGAAFGAAAVEGHPNNKTILQVALPSVLVGPAIGAMVGYHLNYPDVEGVALTPTIYQGGAGLSFGGRF